MPKRESYGFANIMYKLPLDPNKELFKWGPIPGRIFLNSDFVEQTYPEMPEPYTGFGFPEALFIFKGERMIWVNEFDTVWERGKRAFAKFFLHDEDSARFYEAWQRVVKALTAYEE